MSKCTKIWIIIATSFILVGGIIFGGVMTVLDWDFSKLSTVKYVTNNYEINEGYKNISVVSKTADIEFVPSNTANSSVVCYEQENAKHSVEVNGDTLVIKLVDTRKWYEHIGISFNNPKITVYIPEGEYGALSVKLSTGDVTVSNDFKFESFNASASTGDIKAHKISAGTLTLSVTTGNVTVSNVNCEGDIEVSVSTGKTNLTNIRCKNVISSGSTGDMSLKNVVALEKLSVKRSTGDIKLEVCDAAEIFIETDTGDVSGTLISEKVFIIETDTGSINVPKTTQGGRCEITTDTGDITITID
jgi:DUF4097 and DUF4098 domain-containing protein YvlB